MVAFRPDSQAEPRRLDEPPERFLGAFAALDQLTSEGDSVLPWVCFQLAGDGDRMALRVRDPLLVDERKLSPGVGEFPPDGTRKPPRLLRE